jgi:sigma-54 dependent transcriptional regulator, flagellar regulatory protein
MVHAQPLIGVSENIEAIRRLISTMADSPSTVLITGPSGTGKELVARALHEQSNTRKGGNFVPINCGAIPRDLVESELFGHRKGAFTGAVVDRIGRIELAHGGTLFLDEVGDLPKDIQVKLLRVLQERVVEPVGANKSIPVSVRVIAATHKNLEVEMSEGRFREDLFYRLNVLPIHTVALRERTQDIPLLLEVHAHRCTLPGQKPVSFAPCIMQAFELYSWPGNVRELANLVDRFSTLFPGRNLTLQAIPDYMLPRDLADLQKAMRDDNQPQHALDLFPTVPEAVLAEKQPEDSDHSEDLRDLIMLAQGMDELPEEGLPLRQRLADIERSYIEQALQRTDGNVSRTAKLLQVQRTTLIEKINKYELRSDAKASSTNS